MTHPRRQSFWGSRERNGIIDLTGATLLSSFHPFIHSPPAELPHGAMPGSPERHSFYPGDDAWPLELAGLAAGPSASGSN